MAKKHEKEKADESNAPETAAATPLCECGGEQQAHREGTGRCEDGVHECPQFRPVAGAGKSGGGTD